MKLSDDVENLKRLVHDKYTAERVLYRQVKHVNKVLPFLLIGFFITGLIFFIAMLLSNSFTFYENVIYPFWFIYHSLILYICWYLWSQILLHPSRLNRTFIRRSFTGILIFFALAGVTGFLVYSKAHLDYNFLNLSNVFIFIWVAYHIFAIVICYRSWTKVDKIISNPLITTSLSPNKPQININLLNFKPYEKHQLNYFASYTAYRLLLTCLLLVGCLWAIAVTKVVISDVNNFTRITAIVGLYFCVMSGLTSSIGIFKQIFYSFAFPGLITWAVFLTQIDNQPKLIILAFSIIVFILMNAYFVKYNWLTSIKTIQVFLENTQLVSQLETKSKQLEKLSAAKTQFLAVASHDLRQPVQALSLYIETLSATELDNYQRKVLNYAKNASHSCSEMLNTIMDYSHLESGGMIPNIGSIELDGLIQTLVDEFKIEADQKHIRLRYDESNLCVESDPAMLSLILRNLISNAIRYTDEGGVLVNASKIDKYPDEYQFDDKQYCNVKVWDTGSGLTSQEIEVIFDSFYQLDRNANKNQGLGLGLSIVKGLTQLLNIPIEVKSTAECGSQFSIQLPLCEKDYSNNKISSNNLNGKDFDIEVLIVDDEDDVLSSLSLLLGSWGYQPLLAGSIEEAIENYKNSAPKIVITDFQLENLQTGEDVIHAINSITNDLKSEQPVNFIMLTGDTSPHLTNLCNELGVVLLLKPTNPITLRMKLKEIANKLNH